MDPQAGEIQTEHYYRFSDHLVSIPLYDSDRFSSAVKLRCTEYRVLSRTPCGVWLSIDSDHKRFVLDGTRRVFACPTKEAALESYVARKRRQLKLLKEKTRRTESVLDCAVRLSKGSNVTEFDSTLAPISQFNFIIE